MHLSSSRILAVIFLCVIFLSSFCIRMMLILLKEFGSIPSSSVFLVACTSKCSGPQIIVQRGAVRTGGVALPSSPLTHVALLAPMSQLMVQVAVSLSLK